MHERTNKIIDEGRFAGQIGTRFRKSDGSEVNWSARGRTGTTSKYGGYPVDAEVRQGGAVLFSGMAPDVNRWLEENTVASVPISEDITPGPWQARVRWDDEDQLPAVLAPNGSEGFSFVGQFNRVADAVLSAAAPDLADALEKFVRQAISGQHPRVPGDPVLDQGLAALEKAGRLPGGAK